MDRRRRLSFVGFVICALLCVCSWPGPVFAKARLELVGRVDMPGDIRHLAKQGNLVVLTAQLGGVISLDVTDPSRPKELGRLKIAGDSEFVALSGKYAYVCDQGLGLRVIDVSTPAALKEISFYSQPQAQMVVISGQIAYLAAGRKGLVILDIRDPGTPILLGRLEGTVSRVMVDGDKAYLSCEDGVISIVDISRPKAPVELTRITMPEKEYSPDPPADIVGLVIHGQYAYALQGTDIRIFKIEGPASWHEQKSTRYDEGVRAYVLNHDENNLFLAGRQGFSRFDLSRPTQPKLKDGTYPTADMSDVFGLEIDNGYAYVAAGKKGLRIYELDRSGKVLMIGEHKTGGDLRGLAFFGKHAFVADADFGLRVIDIGDPARPNYVAACSLPGRARGLAVQESLAYVANEAGLEIVDVHQPLNPVRVGTFQGAGQTGGVAISGRYAYVTDGTTGVHVLDIARPDHPAEVGLITGTAMGATVAGNSLFIATGDPGMRIYDLADPVHPREIGAFRPEKRRLPEHPCSIKVEAPYVYLLDFYSGLYEIDITQLERPAVVRHINPYFHAAKMSRYASYYLLAGDSGLDLMQWMTTNSANWLDTLDYTRGPVPFGYDVQIQDDLIYLAGETHFGIYRIRE